MCPRFILRKQITRNEKFLHRLFGIKLGTVWLIFFSVIIFITNKIHFQISYASPALLTTLLSPLLNPTLWRAVVSPSAVVSPPVGTSTPVVPDGYVLELVQVLSRHWNRTLESTYKRDPYRKPSYWPEGFIKLTDVSKIKIRSKIIFWW